MNRDLRASALSLCFCLTLLAPGGVARGDWGEVDTFESMAVDTSLNGQNGWTAPEAGVATQRVILDPDGGSNQVLSIFETATGTLNLYKQATLPAGGTGTMFFRMRFGDYDETMVNGPSVGIGMDNVAAPGGSPNVAGPFIVPDGNSGLNEITVDLDPGPSTSNFVPLESLAVETWYSVGMVVDSSSSTFEIWLQGGAFATPTIVDQPTLETAQPYREPSTDDLLSVWIRPNSEHGDAPGQTMYFDDIYLDPAAVNMTDPTAAFPPGDVNMDGFVDIFDVNLVSSHWGETGPAGDANGDMIVDIFDVNLISSNWAPAPPGGAAAVPEPASLGLATLALAGLLFTIRGKIRRGDDPGRRESEVGKGVRWGKTL